MPEGVLLHREKATLWPASANVLAVRDSEGLSLVDVGCGHEETYLRLKEFLASQGFRIHDVHTVVLTHAHPDHMGAMRFLLQEIRPRVLLHPVEVPLAAEPSRLNQTFGMDIPFRYGMADIPRERADIIEYFRSLCPMAGAEATHELEPGGELRLGEFTFQVVETPGHANGLVSLFEESTGLLFSADAVGEVVAWYAPQSGGLTGFLEGLDRLEALPAALLVPSHGGVSGRPAEEIARTRAYLLRREEKIIRQLASGPLPFPELVKRIFKNPLIHLFPGPQIIQCHLDKLEAEGRVRLHGEEEGWLVELVP
ncbi:MAG: MBL fold metallo-hydrolase [Actinobacteria bacterium]|nr:MBL fold metallo-hydrolase [Actinomycetota bacterium]